MASSTHPEQNLMLVPNRLPHEWQNVFSELWGGAIFWDETSIIIDKFDKNPSPHPQLFRFTPNKLIEEERKDACSCEFTANPPPACRKRQRHCLNHLLK
jgi:hypothetical protein